MECCISFVGLEKMKVCFLVGTLGRGGAERQLFFMLRAIQTRGIEPNVLCLTRGEAYEREIKSLGIPVEWIGETKNPWLRLLKIIKALRKIKPDIVQSSHFYTNIYTGLSGRALKIPSIGAVRNDFFSEVKNHKFLGQQQVSLPQFLIANSKLAYERAVKSGVSPEKIEFVRNVVETNGNGNRTKRKISKPDLTILFVGRLVKQKRADRFIRLASALSEKFPDLPLKFEIAGDGKLRDELQTLAKDLKLSPEKLEFFGIRSDMNTFYKRADILISTSDHEGTSNVILEAMANSLPVIATRVGGTPEIVDETRGILIEAGDEDALIKATEKLIFDENLRRHFGLEGKKYVAENHSLDYLEEHLTNIYAKVTAPKN